MLLRRRRGFVEALPENPDESMKSSAEAFVDLSPNPEESYLRLERTKLLTKAIGRLGLTIRTTILLRDIEERSVEEAAKILGTSVSAVKARVFQGRRKLRRMVNPGLFGICKYGRVETRRC
jgi:RNA polymerase sigma-70 factor (ECF subfamily)